MAYTPEFFKQRSFEVVWAVFRVADVCNRPSIARLLEDRALTYFIHKNLAALEDMHEAILFGSKIGEIHEMNMAVLDREIQELREFLSQPAVIPEVNPTPASIDDIFSKSSVLFSTFAKPVGADASISAKMNREREGSRITHSHSPANDFSESGNAIFDEVDNNAVKSRHNDSVSFSGNSPANDFSESGNIVSGKQNSKIIDKISGNSGNENISQLFTSAQRKELIVGLLKNKQFCHINDLLTHLPGVSDRTIRNDIRSLAESRIIERLGNGGPNSFFRLKKSI